MSRPAAAALAPLLLLACAGVARGQDGAPDGDDLPIGDRAPELAFKDLRTLPRSVRELGRAHVVRESGEAEVGTARATALVFVTPGCPSADGTLAEVERLAAAYAGRGAAFALVYVEGSVRAMASHALARGVTVPVLLDAGARGARALGITRTPQVAVLDAAGVLRYRGQIDLAAALDALLAGEPVPLAETPVAETRAGEAPEEGQPLPLPEPAAGQTARQSGGQSGGRAADLAEDVPSWAEDVASLVQRHCQDCHRPRGSAPFRLLTYEQVRRRGEMVAEVVAEGRMPPWFASGGAEAFANHRGLTPAERRTITDWVRAGMPRGERADEPPPRAFPATKWALGQPDLVLRTREPIEVMADGYMPYQYVMLPHRFEADTWVSGIEILGDHPEVLHHCNLFYLRRGQPFDPSQILAGKVPGGAPLDLDAGVAVLIPKGARLGLQVHYQPYGVAVRDHLSVGLVYPRAPVRKRFRAAIVEDRDFEIPPFAPHHRVEAAITFEEDVIAGGLFGHMHLRGKDVTFRATVPGGEPETLLEVPAYSFDWQMGYAFREPRRFPRGTRIECVAHFDNSPFNPYNPDPAQAVGWGLQTYHEMMYCFVFYVREHEDLDLRVDPRTGVAVAGD